MASADVSTAPTIDPNDTVGIGTPLTADGVDRIVAIDDPILRNLWITQSYADLANRILTAFGDDQSWCSFATWASNTAGLSIREAELPHFLDFLTRSSGVHLDAIADSVNRHHPVVRWLGLRQVGLVDTVHRSTLGHLVETALDQVSGFIADGNTLVYCELAPVFVRFVEWLEHDGHRGAPGDVDELLRRLDIPPADDHPLVHAAFRSYVRAAVTTDPHDRAQHVLAANIAAVLHEQQRLQADICAALDAGLDDVGDDLDSICHRVVPDRLRRWIVDRARRRVAPHVIALWEHVATRMMMTLAVPNRTLHLGVDVPPLPDGEMFPPDLRAVHHPELLTLLDEWDPTHGTGRGSAARDWADLHSRMGYIVNLFRSRQQQTELTASPFTDLELATMRDGDVPNTI